MEMIKALADNFQMQERPWGELQSDALDLILNYVHFMDLVRLSRVCKNWRNSCRKHPNYTVLKSPWLVIPQFPSNRTHTLSSPLKSPMKSSTHSINLSIPVGYECFGHSMGWLVIHHATRGYFLLNPLNEKIFRKLPNHPNNVADNSNFFERAIVFDIPYSLSVAAQAKDGGLYLCRPGDEHWEVLIENFYGAFVFYNRWLYCVGLKEHRNMIICYELDEGLMELWKEIVFLPEICTNDTAATYLVMSTSGHLLLVERKYDLLVLNQDEGDEVDDVGGVLVEDVGGVEVEDEPDVEVNVEGDEAEDVADDEVNNEVDEVEDITNEGENDAEDGLDEAEDEGNEVEDVAGEDDEVEDDGDDGNDVVINSTTGFRVFKLDYDRWVRVEKLGKEALFISAHGESCARVLPDYTPSGYRSNCIYFTDMKSGEYLIASDGHYDQGEYSLEDGKVERWFQLDARYFPQNMPYWFFPKV